MQMVSTFILAAVAAIYITGAQRPAKTASVLVTAVVNGDSIDVQSIGRVHLLGIAAPKLDRQGPASAPFAVDARDRLSSLVSNRWVRLEYEEGKTSASRSAYVLLDDGTCVNEVLVREGLARVAGRTTLSRFAQLQAAQAEAAQQGRGLWSPLASNGTEVYQVSKAPKPTTKKPRKPKKKSSGGGVR